MIESGRRLEKVHFIILLYERVLSSLVVRP